MENYVVGSFIKKLREKLNKTQTQLAEELFVSEKTISKWETGRGLPSLSMIENLAKALKVSVIELFNGKEVVNSNKCSNMLKSKFYVCPICGNVISSTGEINVTCCGVKLVEEEPEIIEPADHFKTIDGKLNFRLNCNMTKTDYVSFVSYVTCNSVCTIKLYPEQDCEVNFEKHGDGFVYYYNINNGLYKMKIK